MFFGSLKVSFSNCYSFYTQKEKLFFRSKESERNTIELYIVPGSLLFLNFFWFLIQKSKIRYATQKKFRCLMTLKVLSKFCWQLFQQFIYNAHLIWMETFFSFVTFVYKIPDLHDKDTIFLFLTFSFGGFLSMFEYIIYILHTKIWKYMEKKFTRQYFVMFGNLVVVEWVSLVLQNYSQWFLFHLLKAFFFFRNTYESVADSSKFPCEGSFVHVIQMQNC